MGRFFHAQATHPLPTLQKPVAGQFPCVLAALRRLDVYAEGMWRSGTAVLPSAVLFFVFGKT